MELVGDEDGSEHGVEGFVAVPAAAVLEELEDRDGAEAGVDFLAGERAGVEDVEPCLVEAELVLLDELHDGGGGESLGEAGDAEEGGGLDGAAGFAVGVAEAAGVDELSVSGHGEGSAGDLVIGEEGFHQPVERCEGWGLAARGGAGN